MSDGVQRVCSRSRYPLILMDCLDQSSGLKIVQKRLPGIVILERPSSLTRQISYSLGCISKIGQSNYISSA